MVSQTSFLEICCKHIRVNSWHFTLFFGVFRANIFLGRKCAHALHYYWKNQGRANQCCVNVRILGQLHCSHSTIHSLLNCLRIRRKWENHYSDRLELDLTFGKTFFNYRLQHGTLFQVHKLCHISCFFTCYVLSIANRQMPKQTYNFYKYGQHYGPGSICTSG